MSSPKRRVITHTARSRIRLVPRKSASTAELIELLHALKGTFDPETESLKSTLLAVLSTREISKPELLVAYHDVLLFLLAYPDNPAIQAFVSDQLATFDRRVRILKGGGRRAKDRLIDSGLTDTSCIHTYSYAMARSLITWYSDMLEIDWSAYDEETDPLAGLLPVVAAWNEVDALDNDPSLTAAAWLKKGKENGKSDAETLLRIIASSGLPSGIQSHLFESLELPLIWSLGTSQSSRTNKRVPTGETFYQREPIKPRTRDLRSEFSRPPTLLERLDDQEGESRVRDIKEVLAVRNRELFPLTGANPREVYRISPGRGLDIYLFGTLSEIRLPLETNLGAMLVRNGVPVGYGVGAVLFDRVEIAINVFPAFRTGESSFAIEEYFRLFYRHFGSRVFLVKSYQVGDDNDEALESGSYWFYYKLGFRSVDKQIRALAEKEQKRLQGKRGARSPISTLKRLAVSDMFMTADPARMDRFADFPIVPLSYRVTEWMVAHGNDRTLGTRAAVHAVSAILGEKRLSGWSDNEREALARLAPLIVSIDGLNTWSDAELDLLAHLIRSKGGDTERDYMLACNAHAQYRDALLALAGKRKK